MTKLYIFSRMIHRVLVLIILVSTFVMAGTGIILKYNSLGDYLKIDLGLIRYIHNNFSVVFSIVLTLMMLTGVIMYLYPIVRKK